jgi:S-adenosylmethionine uptake transporter
MVAVLLMFVAVMATVGVRGLASRRPGVLLLKGLFGFLSYTGYYLAIAALPLAQVVTIVFTAPIFATVLSSLVLKEQVGPRRWTAVFAGFVGMMVVIGPTDLVDNIAVLLAVFSALTYALSTLLTRLIGPEESPWTVSLYSMAVFLTGSAAASLLVAGFGESFATSDPSAQFLLRPWALPPTIDLILMLFLGVNAAFGFYCLAKAYLMAPVSVVAPFEYTYIIWAVLFGFFIWSEVPQATTLLGVGILIASSLYILRRELQVGKVGATTFASEEEPTRYDCVEERLLARQTSNEAPAKIR